VVELILLKALLERDIYRKYRHVIKVTEELQPILSALDLWYRNHTENPTIPDVVVNVHLGNPKNPEYIQEVLGRLERIDTPKDLTTLLQDVKLRHTASELALEAYKLASGESTVGNVHRVLAQLEKPDDTEVRFVSQDLGEILSSTTGSNGLRWRLPWLNRSLGSLRKGDFGFVFARPETGKTTFLASECTNFAKQLLPDQGPILWVNNEEQGAKVQLRCYQASLGCTLSDIRLDPKRAEATFVKNGGKKLKILDDSNLDSRAVEAIVASENPSLIVFDQIDKIKGFKNDREDLALGAIYEWARSLAKQYCPIIGVCQASGEAEGVPYLHMGHVANAKTAKQAEADFIIGIGRTHEPGEDYIRYFNISKNKLIGDTDSDPACRHGRQQILIRPEVARYEEI